VIAVLSQANLEENTTAIALAKKVSIDRLVNRGVFGGKLGEMHWELMQVFFNLPGIL